MRHEKGKINLLEDTKFENTRNQGCNMSPLQTEEAGVRLEESLAAWCPLYEGPADSTILMQYYCLGRDLYRQVRLVHICAQNKGEQSQVFTASARLLTRVSLSSNTDRPSEA